MDGEFSGFDALNQGMPEGATGWDYALKPQGEAKLWGRGFPKLPPKQVIPMPKMSQKQVQKAAKITLNPFAFQAITHTAKEAKNKIEEEANALMQKLTYPEPLINEAVNGYLSRF